MVYQSNQVYNVGGDRYNRFHGCDLALPFGGQPGEAGKAVRGDLLRDRSFRDNDCLSFGKDEVP